MIRNIDKADESALDLAMYNSALIAENTKKISSHAFDYQTFLKRLESIETENKKIMEELEDSKKRSTRKTLIFKIIQQHHNKGSWSQTGMIVANEIKVRWKMLTMRMSLRKLEGCIPQRKTGVKHIFLLSQVLAKVLGIQS